MTTTTDASPSLRSLIATSAQRLTGSSEDYDTLLELIGDARFVLIGEASHGTHEFYEERARITQRLIAEKDFAGVAVEADWPDAHRVDRYVRGHSLDADGEEALAGFKRFPTWMWRNTEVVNFIEWLRGYNDALLPEARRIGFYGLDLYSMFTSIDEVLRYLAKVDPAAAQVARARYACFDHYNGNSQRYGYATGVGKSASCADDVVKQLLELNTHGAGYIQRGGLAAQDALFQAKQNARLIVNAEHYYRTMFGNRIASWNLRDRHMAETLDALAQHLPKSENGRPAKIVVWEHNSHVGDARATEVGQSGEWTVGQLARERYGNDTVLIGMTTYRGTVTAASDWGAVAERKTVLPALPGSYEALFRHTGLGRFMLPLRGNADALQALSQQRLERAIGVIYRPEAERQSHYFHACLPRQFDAVLHFDKTRAVEPMELTGPWRRGDAPATFPVGF
jgi:erythromycin esterase-like protein